jgi:hypothetical protein
MCCYHCVDQEALKGSLARKPLSMARSPAGSGGVPHVRSHMNGSSFMSKFKVQFGDQDEPSASFTTVPLCSFYYLVIAIRISSPPAADRQTHSNLSCLCTVKVAKNLWKRFLNAQIHVNATITSNLITNSGMLSLWLDETRFLNTAKKTCTAVNKMSEHTSTILAKALHAFEFHGDAHDFYEMRIKGQGDNHNWVRAHFFNAIVLAGLKKAALKFTDSAEPKSAGLAFNCLTDVCRRIRKEIIRANPSILTESSDEDLMSRGLIMYRPDHATGAKLSKQERRPSFVVENEFKKIRK